MQQQHSTLLDLVTRMATEGIVAGREAGLCLEIAEKKFAKKLHAAINDWASKTFFEQKETIEQLQRQIATLTAHNQAEKKVAGKAARIQALERQLRISEQENKNLRMANRILDRRIKKQEADETPARPVLSHPDIRE